MTITKLTYDECQTRSRILSVDSYVIDLDLTEPAGQDTFRSTTTVTFSCSAPGAASFIDLDAADVHQVQLNGQLLDVDQVCAPGRILLEDLQQQNELTVVAQCSYTNTGEGMHRFRDPVDGEYYLYTQFEVPDARKVFACFEQPDIKATFSFTVMAPLHWSVVSNAPVVASMQREDDRIWSFAPTPRIPTYITAIIAGPYHYVFDSYAHGDESVPLGLYCRRSLADQLDPADIFETTKQGLAYFTEKFQSPFPFPKYDQLFVPEFNASGMENAACVTLREELMLPASATDAEFQRRAETILHELAHMWFGNYVTMTWWDDLWLNEAFATYASNRCLSDATRWPASWVSFTATKKTWAYQQDQLPSTHAVATHIDDVDSVMVNFDGITYAKGASVLKQLVAYVGDDHFFVGLRRYFAAHAWSNATLTDLLIVLEEASGRDLRAWSVQWLGSPGLNILAPEVTTDPDGTITHFAVRQEAPPLPPGVPGDSMLRTHRIAIGFYNQTPDGLHRVQRIEIDVSGPRTPVPELFGARLPEVILVNDDDLAYSKIRLTDRSLAAITRSASNFTDPLARALAWSAAWEMVRDADLSPAAYLKMVSRGIHYETEITALQTLQRQVLVALRQYAAPSQRPALLAQWEQTCVRAFRAAPPGSNEQIVWLRALSCVAQHPQSIILLEDLLHNTAPDGLPLDTALRWTALQRLVVVGAATDQSIERELARDPSALGKQYAAATKAARPDADAKSEAWNSAITANMLPTAVQGAVINGFMQHDQTDLLVPYVSKYFDVITTAWHTHGRKSAQQIVLGLYPAIQGGQEILPLTDSWLTATDAPPALRRLVLECRDGAARSLRAQHADMRRGTR
ncbi:aminopeptidase N [Streptomyces sp. NPDC051020]|uniref:aminopeptidase N n=1 Tax=Streptomyces sp. NPDC051020 TaxID=3155409 RepID=UPI003431BBF6